MEAPAERPRRCWVELVDDRLLGRVFALAGKDQRQCQAVCRRWRRVWFGEPALWRLVRLQPADEGQAEQLAVVRRVGPLVESLHATSTGLMQQTELKALLDSLPAGRRQRLREVWLSAEPSRVRGSLDEWELPGYNPLPAAAVQRLGRLRALRALELDSWQLPHRTASVLCTLSQLTRLRLRARQLPPGCLPGAIDERLTQLRSLVLETAMPCSPEGVAQLTALGALSLLEVHQANTTGSKLLMPPLERLPHLALACFRHMRGQVQLPGGFEAERFAVQRRGTRAAVALAYTSMDRPVASLPDLLNVVVPPGATLDCLQASGMTFDGLAAMRGCTHLSGLRSLVLSGLDCMEGRTQALHAMVEQARGLTELRADMCLDFEGGWAHVRRCLDGVTSLRKLQLQYNHIAGVTGEPFLQNVEDFDLSSNDLQRLPLDAVAAAPRLRALRLAGHADLSVTPDDIRSLAALAPRLELLDLRGARMWPSEAALLARELPQVELLLDGVEGQWLHGYVPPFREHVEWADWVAAAEDAASDDGAGPAREPYAGA